MGLNIALLLPQLSTLIICYKPSYIRASSQWCFSGKIRKIKLHLRTTAIKAELIKKIWAQSKFKAYICFGGTCWVPRMGPGRPGGRPRWRASRQAHQVRRPRQSSTPWRRRRCRRWRWGHPGRRRRSPPERRKTLPWGAGEEGPPSLRRQPASPPNGFLPHPTRSAKTTKSGLLPD